MSSSCKHFVLMFLLTYLIYDSNDLTLLPSTSQLIAVPGSLPSCIFCPREIFLFSPTTYVYLGLYHLSPNLGRVLCELQDTK
jgi:hypothetical protein